VDLKAGAHIRASLFVAENNTLFEYLVPSSLLEELLTPTMFVTYTIMGSTGCSGVLSNTSYQ